MTRATVSSTRFVLCVGFAVLSMLGCTDPQEQIQVAMDQSSPLQLTKTLYRAEQALDIAALIACIHPDDRDVWAPHIRRVARQTEELDALRAVVQTAFGDAEADMLDQKGFDTLYGAFSGAKGGTRPDWGRWAFRNVDRGRADVYVDGALRPGQRSLWEGKWYVGPEPEAWRGILRISRSDRQRDTRLYIKEIRRVKRAIQHGEMTKDDYHQWLNEAVPTAR